MANTKLDWRDVLVFGEMKSKHNRDTSKVSFINITGKMSILLCAQDGRHAAPSLRILGSHVTLMFFDRGGSLETDSINIHSDPELFLHILVGLTKASLSQLGFDESLLDDSGSRCVLIIWKGRAGKVVTIDKLLFISDIMHGRGTMVWGGLIALDLDLDGSDLDSGTTFLQTRRGVKVVIKDCFGLTHYGYTEGHILAVLNDTGVEDVLTFI
ncbi:hypothetical protein JVT61DRAFT_15603 [Boletus reticuloceps]|uniref:Fungal-type protein kinase domain-containing protein n=1 Tax=Boletus reticuloceps TaxID=495285 RepID=A0A8I2YC58_9AGAM|nr:hypothetical protein JVT61DRAFT_1511 [Boletus reticuloceps]KAG6369238.1 hypothetical protein JVT61DRAFT_15603 [Boletus reticuloceps]